MAYKKATQKQNSRLNQEGVASMLQVILMANKYSDVLRLAKPPFYVQKIIFAILMPFLSLMGYRPFYKKYFD